MVSRGSDRPAFGSEEQSGRCRLDRSFYGYSDKKKKKKRESKGKDFASLTWLIKAISFIPPVPRTLFGMWKAMNKC